MAIPLERDLAFDPLFARHADTVEEALHAFRPEVVHITGPSDLGLQGAYFAARLGLPLAASWHTNLHEYAARRLGWLTVRAAVAGAALSRGVERCTLAALLGFYSRAEVLYAPNPALCSLLEARTGRACHLMTRGVDSTQFTPARRTRADPDGELILGYVGRLSAEKNVGLLPRVDAELRARGLAPRWLIVGEGGEEASLRRGLPLDTTFTGVLHGEALATAYANMDVFVFPSHTDTFGNAVLEAVASRVPAVVTPEGGPAFIVRDGITGRVVPEEGFANAIAGLVREGAGRLRQPPCEAAPPSWDAVFAKVIAAYPRRSADRRCA